jgi:MYXO-CTERM domain-containing protein
MPRSVFQPYPKTMKKLFIPLSCIALSATATNAALTVTNGNFETGGGNNIDNVTSWNDYNSSFWHGAWVTNASAITPNGTNVVVLGSNDNSATTIATISANVNDGSYLYQSIGTAAGATSLQVNFDFGQPDDDNGGRTLGMTVGIYAYDGLGGFTAADNTDVRGASGVSFLGAQSFTYNSVNLNDQIFAQIATISLSGAGTQELFLRFNNYRPANTQSWSVIDNVTITPIPEPAAALLGGLGLLGLLRRRRN